MSYAILKHLGLDHLDADSPDLMKALGRLQKDAWYSLQRPANETGPAEAVPEVDERAIEEFLANWT